MAAGHVRRPDVQTGEVHLEMLAAAAGKPRRGLFVAMEVFLCFALGLTEM